MKRGSQLRRDGLARFYPSFAVILLILWFVWWLVPLSPEHNPEGVVRLLGFLLINLLFFVLGICGLVLSYLGVLMYELSSSCFFFFFIQLIGFMSESPWSEICYTISILLVGVFAVVFVVRLR